MLPAQLCCHPTDVPVLEANRILIGFLFRVAIMKINNNNKKKNPCQHRPRNNG